MSVSQIEETDQTPAVSTPTPPSPLVEETKEILPSDVFDIIFDAYNQEKPGTTEEACQNAISQYLKQIVKKHSCSEKYNVLVLYDESIMLKGDADNIYSAVKRFTEKKPLLLILHSGGGDGAAAYLIGKLCRESCAGLFVIVVPRMAKSAATLMACAADQIHMGSLSELGPIDPQIDRMPALGLKHSVEHIAELAKKYPEASGMFAQYLASSLQLINLGYYERVAQSAEQYAEKLLLTHEVNLVQSPRDIAKKLVHDYKDHGFVIDTAEARQIFGSEVVKNNTEEYELGNDIYQAMTLVRKCFDLIKHDFYFIGSLDAKPVVTRRRERAKHGEKK